MTDATALTATLRSIRAKLNLTQEQLAERLGVSFATVNRWEGGSSKPQKAAREVIAALATEAGLDGLRVEEQIRVARQGPAIAPEKAPASVIERPPSEPPLVASQEGRPS